MRVTNTNSGPDSSGVVSVGSLSLPGQSYLFLVVGAVAALFVFILTYRANMLVRLLIAAIPLTISLAWVKYFLMGRPPHFQGDFFERMLAGKQFNLRPQDWAKAKQPRGNRVLGT